MILSVSRRTDIPGCYPEWFMNRLRDKYVMTRNPMNFHQVSQINLSPDFIECIVFWTKNAVPFMDYLEELNRMGYMYMFQYTITPYDNTLEKNISDKSDIIKNVLELSEKIEKKRGKQSGNLAFSAMRRYFKKSKIMLERFHIAYSTARGGVTGEKVAGSAPRTSFR